MNALTQSVRLDLHDAEGQPTVAVITVDNPPVNALSFHVRQGILDGVSAAVADPAVAAIVLLCAGRTFIAGADITEFAKPPQPPSLQGAQAAMENCPKPVIAAIPAPPWAAGWRWPCAPISGWRCPPPVSGCPR